MEKTHTQGETWQEALKRLDNFTKNESSLIHLDSDVDHEEISEFEKRLTISLPEDLKQFYTQYKSLYVYIDEKIFFAIFPLSELSTNSYITKTPESFIGLAAMISMFGEGEEDGYLKTDLSPEMYDYLNKNYKLFGFYGLSDCDSKYWYFDKNGNYGVQEFIHDDYDMWIPKLRKMDKDVIPSLNELISKAVDQTLIDFDEYLE